MIRAGRVRVNNVVVTDAGYSCDPEGDKICIDNTNPIGVKRYIYAALYKPDGCLTATEDRRLPTVADLFPSELLGKGLAPVGRLDFHTTGLLLMTNNGLLSHRMTSPKWHVAKEYRIRYSGDPLGAKERQLFAEGLLLSEKNSSPVQLEPAELTIVSEEECLLTIYEGKTHQVRRMIAAVGRDVVELKRERIGELRLCSEQRPGEYRMLSDDEIRSLFEATGMNPDDK